MKRAVRISGVRELSRDGKPSRAGKLARVLLIKAVCDLIFVVALAGGSFIAALTPWIDGHVEAADSYVSGRISERIRSDTSFDVQLFIDGNFIAHRIVKCASSSNVIESSLTSGGCEFRFELQKLESGEHEARVFASEVKEGVVHRVLHLLGKPQRFATEN